MVHQIREIGINDIEHFVKLLSTIYDESDYLIYNPGEYAPSNTDAVATLEHYITSPSNAISQKIMANSLALQSSLQKISNAHVMKHIFLWVL